MPKSTAEIAGEIVVMLFQNRPQSNVTDTTVASVTKAYETIYNAIAACESSSTM